MIYQIYPIYQKISKKPSKGRNKGNHRKVNKLLKTNDEEKILRAVEKNGHITQNNGKNGTKRKQQNTTLKVLKGKNSTVNLKFYI